MDTMASVAGNGIVDKLSQHSVEQTVDRLKSLLQSKGVTLFALVDHSGEAAKVGMKMPPTKLLIFGSPNAANIASMPRPSPSEKRPFVRKCIVLAHAAVTSGWRVL